MPSADFGARLRDRHMKWAILPSISGATRGSVGGPASQAKHTGHSGWMKASWRSR
jgi:hypothetical protein